ncbi:MAG: MMPL family transporter [Gammaproteobacteria bacterium]|jgi:predicted RND superfamily exporter protein|nr:MMPL family transporter [Gammaproteobacteria bacterium]
MRAFLATALDRYILDRPWLALGAVAAITFALAAFLPRFELDASADSLLLENDSDLRYYREIVARYGSDDYLLVTYTARDDLFSAATLADLTALRDELAALPSVAQIISMLDVPLISGPDTSLTSLQRRIPTLSDPATDRELARRELRESPVYSNLLMSLDGDTTALLLRLRRDPEYQRLLNERDELRDKAADGRLDAAGRDALRELDQRIQALRSELTAQQEQDIDAIRDILSRHAEHGEIHLGGLPMIVSDMIDYIRSDIVVFGTGILLFLIVLLRLIFGRPRWVIVSLLCCLVAVVMIAGLLGLLGWQVTVVSSNFVALMLIFSLSLTVHLIQRYRELHTAHPDADQRWLVRSALRDKANPCLFTALTTMVGFASLLISGIRPVIDFGWMMVMGMVAVLGTAFVLFPATLMFFKPGEPRDRGDSTRVVTGYFARLVEHWPRATAALCIGLLGASVAGILQLEVENRFIDYFKSDTEIYQGMVVIDSELGGTTPLDVILDADPEFMSRKAESRAADDFAADEFADEFADGGTDEFTDEFAEEFTDPEADEFAAADAEAAEASAAALRPDLGSTSYWYNSFRLEQVRAVHDYLDGLPETGKVLSLATTLEMLETLNQDEAPGTFFLSVLYKRLPDEIKEALVDPYLSADGNQVRFSMRVMESDRGLRRDELLERIRTHLVDEMGFAPGRVNITGMMVLYNNVLQSLYRSQILTLGAVFLAIMVMFGVLFRSLSIALIAVLPSILSVGIVLGCMGWAGIPLDIMTITIAAISVGIGVDDSIHYIHRYLQEMEIAGDPILAMRRSHASVGRAMMYTSIIIIAGFSVLALSNFIPSILFGLLTGLAMLMALIANLTLLPLLLRWGRITAAASPA